MRNRCAVSPASAGQNCADGLFRAAFDANPVPMWIWDAEALRVLAVNDRALRCFDQSREQFLASAPPFRAMPEGSDELQYHRKPDGTILALRLETSPIDFDGRPLFLAVAVDAGEEILVRADIARYRGFLGAAAEWVWEWDAAGRISLLSPEFTASTGVPAQAVLGRKPDESAPTPEAEEAWNGHRAAVEAHRPFRDSVFKLPGADGGILWLEIGGTPVFGGDGVFQGYRGVGRNVTAKVEADLALRKRERRYVRFFEEASV
jgi:PAS domain S-box-containing protein